MPWLGMLLGTLLLAAQLKIQVVHENRPVPGAIVVVNGRPQTTDPAGEVTVTVPAGEVRITVEKEGFFPGKASLVASAEEVREVVIELQERHTVEEEITVSATRTDVRLDDQPTRVEVLNREEVEEKLMMTPGDIVMMLNEMGGLRVQATSPSLGSASVRVQGLRGRYTRFLTDGLPLFGTQAGGLGLLQIPPMDLGQVEVIKGNASALYGAGAVGGVVNLISRRPGPQPGGEMLLNGSSRGATDAVLWWAGPLTERWGMTLLAGGHGQTQNDVDGDGWADLPGYARGVFRPRFFWDGGNGRSFFATAGVTYEDRTGGTVSGRTLPATGAPYREAVNTLRVDFGAVGQTLLQGKYVLTGRVALAEQKHDHQYGDDRERDRHQTGFAEVSLRGHSGRHTWVGGAALDSDGYRPKDVRPLQYTFTVPGLFVHDEIEVKPWFSLSASGRVDWHSKYGAFFSPRISVLLRSGGWSSRISAGVGFFGPSPLTEETEAAGLARLVIPRPLRAERSQSASLDVTRRQGPASVTFTLFASRVRDPLYVDRSQGLTLTNLADPTTNLGGEFLGTLRHAPWSLTGTYTLVRSLESPAGRRQEVPLSPRHSAGLVGTWEKEKVARIGVEWYYTGEQRLEENPYRGRSQPYFVMGFLGERRFGPLSLFVNGENLTGVKQSHWDPLLRPSRAADGRWTVDAWAPLEGRNINGGIRVRF